MGDDFPKKMVSYKFISSGIHQGIQIDTKLETKHLLYLSDAGKFYWLSI